MSFSQCYDACDCESKVFSSVFEIHQEIYTKTSENIFGIIFTATYKFGMAFNLQHSKRSWDKQQSVNVCKRAKYN